MFIKDLYEKDLVVSLEIFPPKPTDSIQTIYQTLEGLKDLSPDFISVTYGAGGQSKSHTLEIANIIKNKYHIEALAHLTCSHSTRSEIDAILSELQAKGIENILALRGDIPLLDHLPTSSDFHYAKDLVSHIEKSNAFGIGCACYPEGHLESLKKVDDLKHLKEKVQCGADFLISQLFFDNQLFYDFLEKLDLMDLDIPVSAGIMPVINTRQIQRITSMCGVAISDKFKRIIEKYEYKPQALKEAGMAYATEQIIDLIAFGVQGIHLYTMNRPEVARKIIGDISHIRKAFAS